MPVIYDADKPIDLAAITSPIFADTNVVANMFYDNINSVSSIPQSRRNELMVYQRLIVNMRSQAVPLFLTALSLAELQSLFVRRDHEIYVRSTGTSIKLKAYRRLADSIADRKARYPLMFAQILSTATCYDSTVTVDDIRRFVDSMDVQVLDPTDFCIADQVKAAHGILMTDDGDFDGSGCDLITRNPQLISHALANGYTQLN